MKKIEKEEQLKKQLERAMEEQWTANSESGKKETETAGSDGRREDSTEAAVNSTATKGKSVVVTEKEEKKTTEPEPTLSEEELNAMYERFQQRLQERGLADAEGNPTEKTLQIRRKIVEEKAERRKRAEKQKQTEKKAKTAKHWVRAAKAAGIVLVVGACVFGASMTSEANRIRLVETINGVRNTGDVAKMNNGEDREYSAGSIEEAKQEIKDILHIAVPEFYYVPDGMAYSNVEIIPAIQMAIIEYEYNGQHIYFHLAANDKDLSQGNWKDRKQIKVEILDEEINVEMGKLLENNEEYYYATWKYKDAYYQIGGDIEKEEIIKILNEMQYNM
ncbi:DUF4367 domain-containing protein [Fusicatenibacter sp.]